MNYSEFIFREYKLDSKVLSLTYNLDDKVSFTETFTFDFDFAKHDVKVLDCALKSLFIMAGVSYYKAYLPKTIRLPKFHITADQAKFFSETYQKGLGEFFYVNQLDPKTVIEFPHLEMSHQKCQLPEGNGMLIGIGGGKDSLVSVELFKDSENMATWSVGHRQQLAPLVQVIGKPHYFVDRQIDKTLLEHNEKGAYNGHVPISAILACVGVVVAILSGKRDVVVSNESSASDPSLEYQGVSINHQYSKSLEFEKAFQTHLNEMFDDNTRYYSLLRPFSELRIAQIFSRIGWNKYLSVFTSCNRAFTQDSNHIFWCGECPKCAFTFLIFSPFVPRPKLEELFGGKNLLLDLALETTYKQLLGIEGDKPLDCVGEIKEARSAMELIRSQYPELQKYQYEIPGDYNYKRLAENSMPEDIYNKLQTAISSLPNF